MPTPSESQPARRPPQTFEILKPSGFVECYNYKRAPAARVLCITLCTPYINFKRGRKSYTLPRGGRGDPGTPPTPALGLPKIHYDTNTEALTEAIPL